MTHLRVIEYEVREKDQVEGWPRACVWAIIACLCARVGGIRQQCAEERIDGVPPDIPQHRYGTAPRGLNILHDVVGQIVDERLVRVIRQDHLLYAYIYVTIANGGDAFGTHLSRAALRRHDSWQATACAQLEHGTPHVKPRSALEKACQCARCVPPSKKHSRKTKQKRRKSKIRKKWLQSYFSFFVRVQVVGPEGVAPHEPNRNRAPWRQIWAMALTRVIFIFVEGRGVFVCRDRRFGRRWARRVLPCACPEGADGSSISIRSIAGLSVGNQGVRYCRRRATHGEDCVEREVSVVLAAVRARIGHLSVVGSSIVALSLSLHVLVDRLRRVCQGCRWMDDQTICCSDSVSHVYHMAPGGVAPPTF